MTRKTTPSEQMAPKLNSTVQDKNQGLVAKRMPKVAERIINRKQ